MDIKINLFINLKINLVFSFFPEKCIKFYQSVAYLAYLKRGKRAESSKNQKCPQCMSRLNDRYLGYLTQKISSLNNPYIYNLIDVYKKNQEKRKKKKEIFVYTDI